MGAILTNIAKLMAFPTIGFTCLFPIKSSSLHELKFRDILFIKSWTYTVTFLSIKHLGVLQFNKLSMRQIRAIRKAEDT